MRFFEPERFFARITRIDIQKDLLDRGFTHVLMDIDNTILTRDDHSVPADVAIWLAEAREAGITFCLLSNNWHQGVYGMAEDLELPIVAKAIKPLAPAFAIAMRKIGAKRKSTVVIGDQMTTDVIGAHSFGLTAYMLKPLVEKDLPHTLFFRKFEHLFMGDMPFEGSLATPEEIAEAEQNLSGNAAKWAGVPASYLEQVAKDQEKARIEAEKQAQREEAGNSEGATASAKVAEVAEAAKAAGEKAKVASAEVAEAAKAAGEKAAETAKVASAKVAETAETAKAVVAAKTPESAKAASAKVAETTKAASAKMAEAAKAAAAPKTAEDAHGGYVAVTAEPSSKLYILGHPVAHSKSPVMHNAAYRLMGVPWHYDFADFDQEANARAFIQNGDFLGINITMPYKPLAFECAARVADEAVLAQGANVLVNTKDGLVAHNTDGTGCVAFLQSRGVQFEGAKCVVCGTGPTSLSIASACVRAGAEVTLLGRDADRTKAVAAGWNERFAKLLFGESGVARVGERLASASYEEADDILRSADVILDATPLGMNEGDPAAFDTSLLREGQVVYDAVYGHGTTALAAGAAQAGCRFFDGAGMLVAQAVVTVQILAEETGATAPSFDELFNCMAAAARFDL